MSADRWDVIVVGAGPAGGMAAWSAARAGLRTLLLEEHGAVGTPPHCSGKLSRHAFAEFGLPLALARTALRAATVYAPDGGAARVRRDAIDSYVVDRDVLDRWLAEQAQAAGATLLLGARARRAVRTGGEVTVAVERRGPTLTLRAPLIIDAEGARTLLPQTLGLRPRRVLIQGLQYEMEGLRLEAPDAPELYFGRAWAPGFFAWIMPLGERSGRAGLCIDPRLARRSPRHYLERLIADHPVVARRARGARIIRRLVGRIPILGARGPSFAPGLLLAGDAAGQVKATSGGGIYFSLIAGRLAAEAAGAWVGGDPGALRRYEQAWRARFGRELRFTAAARRTLTAMSDAGISRVIRHVADNPLLAQAIEEHGDTQYQSRLLRPLLAQLARSWRDAALLPPVIAAFARGLIALDHEQPAPALPSGR
jgi:geranylgeranyl reductase family protein